MVLLGRTVQVDAPWLCQLLRAALLPVAGWGASPGATTGLSVSERVLLDLRPIANITLSYKPTPEIEVFALTRSDTTATGIILRPHPTVPRGIAQAFLLVGRTVQVDVPWLCQLLRECVLYRCQWQGGK